MSARQRVQALRQLIGWCQNWSDASLNRVGRDAEMPRLLRVACLLVLTSRSAT
jgi:hypothetical protein